MPNRYIQPNDNPELTNERKNCPFDTDVLAARIWRSGDVVRRRKEIRDYVESVDELRNSTTDVAHLSRLKQVENAYRNAVLLFKHQDKCLRPSDPTDIHSEIQYFRQLITGFDGFPFHVHNAMFTPSLNAMCDEEQQRKWLPRAWNNEICGTYAQTELAHGTNLKKLETTATYDPKTQEFALNTPTITSTKWMPGNLGKSTNYIVLMAQLWTHGKCYGPHAFIVQTRDENTHRSMPGVTLGDLGSKIGINTVDNGFLKLNNVRIPRRQMLMGHSKVHEDGQYEAPIHAKTAFLAMSHVRAFMVSTMGHFLAMASTIAIRYSCIRRQGQIDGGEEVKLLDYRTQQYRLLPQLARAFCFCFAGHYSLELYSQVMDDLKKGKTTLLADMHALNSGLKSVTSFQTAQGIEQCRMSCGGHGYLLASGIPLIFGVSVGACTYEGDNIVMLMQLSRNLVKIATEIINGSNGDGVKTPLNAYLFDANQPKKSQLNRNQSREQQWAEIERDFEHVARDLIFDVSKKLQRSLANRVSHEVAWSNLGVQLTKAAKAHTRAFLARNFIQKILNESDSSIRATLSDVLHVYLHFEVQDCRGDLFVDGYLSREQFDFSSAQLDEALQLMRKNAVNIVDSFDFADRELNSCLGRRDGHVYQALMESTKKSPLNKTDVLPFHDETLGQIMRSARKDSKI